jgi:hypothetical protein
MDFHSPVYNCVRLFLLGFTPLGFYCSDFARMSAQTVGNSDQIALIGCICVSITGKEWRKIEVVGNGAPWFCSDEFV